MAIATKATTAQPLASSVLHEITTALHGLQYGSVEVYVCGGQVAQITTRSIKKMKSKVHVTVHEFPKIRYQIQGCVCIGNVFV